jgi:hypothetical protein
MAARPYGLQLASIYSHLDFTCYLLYDPPSREWGVTCDCDFGFLSLRVIPSLLVFVIDHGGECAENVRHVFGSYTMFHRLKPLQWC